MKVIKVTWRNEEEEEGKCANEQLNGLDKSVRLLILGSKPTTKGADVQIKEKEALRKAYFLRMVSSVPLMPMMSCLKGFSQAYSLITFIPFSTSFTSLMRVSFCPICCTCVCVCVRGEKGGREREEKEKRERERERLKEMKETLLWQQTWYFLPFPAMRILRGMTKIMMAKPAKMEAPRKL